VSLRHLLALLLALYCSLGARAQASPTGLPGVNIAALASARDRLYVGSFDQGLFLVEANGQAHGFADPALDPHINALAWSEAEQRLWVGTARGLVLCNMDQPVTSDRQRALGSCRRIGPSKAVQALLLGGGADVVAGGDAGLTFLRGDATRVFGRKQGAPFRSVWALAERDGALFVGTTNGLFWGKLADFAPRRVLHRASLVQGTLPDDWVTALLSQDQRLYVGTYNAGVAGFRVRSQQLDLELSDVEPGYVNPAGLIAIGDGQLAIASMDGLRCGPLSATQRLGPGTRDVTAIARASAGYYFIGTRQGLEVTEELRAPSAAAWEPRAP